MNPNFPTFQKLITNPVKYKLFMLTKLPMGFISGLKIVTLTPDKAEVSVRFKWVNQNPFKSIYFAVLSMAAELSTGVLGFANIYKSNPTVSMLVTKVQGEFYKKAVGTITFTCTNGNEVAQAIQETIATGKGITIPCTSIGVNQQGEEVAKFIFEWSFKAKT
jgi:Domain of unknown function (DUF4442)